MAGIQRVKDATRDAGLDIIYQLLDCCNPDGLRKNLLRVHRDKLASCNECELRAKYALKKRWDRTETNPSVLTVGGQARV